jgi:hypothetical protein
MDQPAPYKHIYFPITGLHKLGDLLYYEGPILSWFKDDLQHNYLFYWIDYNQSSNRWLIWKVSDENIYYYLNGHVSLRDLILVEDKDFVFIVDIDDNLSFTKAFPLAIRHVRPELLPAEKSYYKLNMPPFAKALMDKYETSDNYYKILMKKQSIVFNISPTNINFARAVTTHDAGSFLSRLTRSLNGFIEESFWKKYRDIIQSGSDYNRFLNDAKAILAPRLFGLRFGSFEVLVGIDTVKKIDVADFTDWQHSVLPDYEKDVVDVDYNDTGQLQVIAEKYSDSAREKIYEPYIKIINNPHYNFTIKDKADKIVRAYRRVAKEKEDIVVPPKKERIDEMPKQKKFMNLVVEVTEGQDVTEINKKLLQSGLLFSEQLDEVHLHFDNVAAANARLRFKSPIRFTLSLVNNIYTAYVEDLSFYLENPDKGSLLRNLEAEIVALYKISRSSDDNDPIKMFFDAVVDSFEEIQ